MDALEELTRVYDYGSKKYADHNWAKGLSWEQIRDSLMRHMTKWSLGEDFDKESGLPHDVHITWNALTLIAMRIREKGEDDRFKLNDK
jgi:orotate phosphoribosyltransferase-like protein